MNHAPLAEHILLQKALNVLNIFQSCDGATLTIGLVLVVDKLSSFVVAHKNKSRPQISVDVLQNSEQVHSTLNFADSADIVFTESISFAVGHSVLLAIREWPKGRAMFCESS